MFQRIFLNSAHKFPLSAEPRVTKRGRGGNWPKYLTVKIMKQMVTEKPLEAAFVCTQLTLALSSTFFCNYLHSACKYGNFKNLNMKNPIK